MARAKPLVIVESPTKVKTINKILGGKYKVVSSMGHLIDLPKSKLGVDIEHDFAPELIVVRAKQKLLSQLKKDAQNRDTIYIATDPDREGEAIGWNLIEHLGKGKKIYRVTFQEITKEAVTKAFEEAREFDRNKIDAQVARRVLDRIVGYKISPLLWKKVGSRLSAGRVQSVALRLIVEREREIQSFVPQEYWQVAVDLQKDKIEPPLTAGLERIDGEKFEIKNESEARGFTEEIRQQNFSVTAKTRKESRRRPNPPFITSTLQQDAFNKLNFDADRTMRLAQQLYEGVELGDGETTGLITYMRTDSVNISKEAIGRVRALIKENYGGAYLPETANVYKSKKSAQEAHEAIRPSDVRRRPEHVKDFLDDAQYRLYTLIWNRFVSSQMTPAVFENNKIEVTAGRFLFGATGSTLKFDGHLVLDLDRKDDTGQDLAPYDKGDALALLEVKPTQHFTKPPPRYSDASLVKALEEDGIGRPSTYASIIRTLVYRYYVNRNRGYFTATDLGMTVCDQLVEFFPKIMDVGFTAKMEEHLDEVEEGHLNHVKLLKDFYRPFEEELNYAQNNMEKSREFIDKTCPECQRQLEVKWGRKGRFLSCSGFPECKYAEPYTTGVKCPEPDCDGELVKRRSRRGTFYGCSRYPKCTHTANQLPGESK